MASPTSTLPTRSATNATRSSTLSDDELPNEDTSEVTRLFHERLRAWKHACGYLEDYVTATEKLHHSHVKEYEKVLKTVTHPLREGEHFDQSLGGVAGFFDNLRSNTQAIANSNADTAKALKTSVLPIFERLHTEIKNKTKELTKGAGKGSKEVDKARALTQKHIELLGQHSASYDSTGGKISAADDPYVLRRGVVHRLHKQIVAENNNRSDILAVQNNFATFEAHVVQTLQSGLGQFNTIITKQADLTKTIYGDVVATAQRIPVDFEWHGFVKRNAHLLIDPSSPPRSIENAVFPNQDHRSTVPLISGSLDRKGKLMRRYETSYYVVTGAKFLHEFKSDDDISKEPSPELSLYLPDCAVGAIDGEKFDVKGKDVSGGKLGSSISLTHNYSFKAHTAHDAAQWWEIIRKAAGQVTLDKPEPSLPNSPVSPSSHEGEKFGALAAGHQVTGTEGHAAPAQQAAPATSAADEKAAIAAREAAQKEAAHSAAIDHAAAPQASYVPNSNSPTGGAGKVPSSIAAPAPASAQPSGPVATFAGPGQEPTTKPAAS